MNATVRLVLAAVFPFPRNLPAKFCPNGAESQEPVSDETRRPVLTRRDVVSSLVGVNGTTIAREKPSGCFVSRRAAGGREFSKVSSAAFAERSYPVGAPTSELRSHYDDIPAVIRDELNADGDRDVLVRMRYLARKKRMRQPNISDEEMADYLALAENRKNLKEWLKFRRGEAAPVASPGVIGWFVGVVAVVGLLTAGLIAAIAVSAL